MLCACHSPTIDFNFIINDYTWCLFLLLNVIYAILSRALVKVTHISLLDLLLSVKHSGRSRILCKDMPFKICIQNLVTLFYNYIICIVKL
jgi:hypothetical protein